jgi:hypothetical protein
MDSNAENIISANNGPTWNELSTPKCKTNNTVFRIIPRKKLNRLAEDGTKSSGTSASFKAMLAINANGDRGVIPNAVRIAKSYHIPSCMYQA